MIRHFYAYCRCGGVPFIARLYELTQNAVRHSLRYRSCGFTSALPPAESKEGSLDPYWTTDRDQGPLGLPPVPVPEDNPPTVETIALGRRLYYDPRLSADGSISCAT